MGSWTFSSKGEEKEATTVGKWFPLSSGPTLLSLKGSLVHTTLCICLILHHVTFFSLKLDLLSKELILSLFQKKKTIAFEMLNERSAALLWLEDESAATCRCKGGKYQFIKIELQHQPYMVIDLTDDPEPEWLIISLWWSSLPSV